MEYSGTTLTILIGSVSRPSLRFPPKADSGTSRECMEAEFVLFHCRTALFSECYRGGGRTDGLGAAALCGHPCLHLTTATHLTLDRGVALRMADLVTPNLTVTMKYQNAIFAFSKSPLSSRASFAASRHIHWTMPRLFMRYLMHGEKRQLMWLSSAMDKSS